MYCMKCGNQVPDGSKFCSSCGAPIEVAQQPKPAVNTVKSELPPMGETGQRVEAMAGAAKTATAPQPAAVNTAARPAAGTSFSSATNSELPSLEDIQKKARELSQGTAAPQPVPPPPTAPTAPQPNFGAMPQQAPPVGQATYTQPQTPPVGGAPPVYQQPPAYQQQPPVGNPYQQQPMYQPTPQPTPQQLMDKYSIAFLVLSIVAGVVALFVLPIVFVPIGVVLGALYMKYNKLFGLLAVGGNVVILILSLLLVS